ncbi:MAG: membrane protein insertase YidC [Steroidobacteraceae bacterium]
MKNPRLFIWVALALVLFLNYEQWMRDYTVVPPTAPVSVDGKPALVPAPAAGLDASIPEAPVGSVPAAPAVATAAAATAGGAVAGDAAPTGEHVHVRTNVLDIDIGLRGAELSRADLLKYPKVKNQPAPVRLLRREGVDSLYVLQTGLSAPGQPNAQRPTHLAMFQSAQDEYVLDGTRNEVRVPLTWSDGNGVTVTKTYIFHRDMYRVDLEYSIDNRTAAPWQLASYAQLLHDTPPIERSYFNVETYAFSGPAIYDGVKYQKLKIDNKDDANLTRDIKAGWIAALQHHFVSAIVPPLDQNYHYTLRARGHQYLATAVGPAQTVAANSTATIKETLYVGPKLQAQLETLHPELSRAADYGMLTFLSKPLFWLLEKIHGIFGNWGVAIVLTTFLLKLVFYPLSEASGKSMAKMKNLAPRIKNLQETYKDDREKLGRAMMELYKREKVNPAAGCLPILIQLPVFLAFYWVLLESVEMRQAPFFGWLQDLSSPDPFFVLPAIMAAAMFAQYKLQPTPADPIQAKVFMILPLVMSATFAFFPSGLVLYWVTNTLLSIAQQWNINRRIAAKTLKA